MLKINIQDKLKDKGLNKNQFAKLMQIGYPAACSIYDGKTDRIFFDTLEKVCIALDCTPNDILVFDDIVSSYTDDEYKFLYSVLNHRNNEMKTTHSSTNSSEMESRLKSRLIRDGGLEISLSMKSRNNMFGA